MSTDRLIQRLALIVFWAISILWINVTFIQFIALLVPFFVYGLFSYFEGIKR